ncbi:MAG: ABC-F family ATP-binding cassette domain-containing protein [Paludibacteraceae bacterium]|nr:ABC-F family ATP-binding cassette domain-containing protein [Paludibacteraceae bacterium]
MYSVSDLTVNFTGDPLFEGISFVMADKERVALCGKNGAGKSTLLKIFAGVKEPSGGSVSMPKGTRVGYLPQHLLTEDGRTVVEEVKLAYSGVTAMREEANRIGEQIATREDYESEEYQKLIERLNEIEERLGMMGESGMMGEIEKTMVGLGFKRTDLERPCSEFSGGWRMRIELAKILLSRPDLLLLDEPTNHLDIESIQWLEGFLKTSGSGLILVSHDRAFLDAVTTRTIEITLGRIYDYKASYSGYVKLRLERREQQLRAYENQQKVIADTEDFIERFRYKATKAVQVQSRIKALERMERIEVDEMDNSAVRLKFPPAPRSGSLPVEVEGMTVSYGGPEILKNVDLQIKRGEKVAFVGKNGEGKSTLVKCLMESPEVEVKGTCKLGYGVKVGYFAQNQASLLDETLSVFDTIDRVAVGDIRTRINDILGAFMFGGEASEKKVGVLSGGERSRLAMIRLLLSPVNLLILDEPTNHLDMRTKDVLKEAIKAFDGTVIVVSHDREFLSGMVEKVYEFGGGKIRECLGGIEEWLEMRAKERAVENGDTVKKTIDSISTGGKGEFERRKEESRQAKKAERDKEKLEAQIEKTEAEIAAMEERFAKGETNEELMRQYAEAKEHCEQLWEKLI